MTAQPLQDLPVESGYAQALRIREFFRSTGKPVEEYNDYRVIAEFLMTELGIPPHARDMIRTWVRSGVAGVIRSAEDAEHRPSSLAGRVSLRDAARERANGNVTRHSQAGRQQPPRCAYDLLGIYIIEVGKRFGDFTLEDHEQRFQLHSSRHDAHARSMRSHRWAKKQIEKFSASSLYDIPRDKLEPSIPDWLRP